MCGRAQHPIQVIAVDGKTLCGSACLERTAFHLVSAYATQNRFCLAQQCVGEKSNEITTIPALMDMLAIESCVVTIERNGLPTGYCPENPGQEGRLYFESDGPLH